jgi:hypothetical protein
MRSTYPHLAVLSVLVTMLLGCTPSAVAKEPQMKDEIAKLIAKIDDDPDILHTDYTPAVHKLIKIGKPAIDPVLDLMLASDKLTRLRAQRVLEGITMKTFGFVVGQGWTKDKGEMMFKEFWTKLGDLNWEADAEMRKNAVKKWREWLSTNK